MLRPMTCPHHFELYLFKPRSYKELPMRLAELAKLYRYEQSGELTGLIRVRSFCLADAHIICQDPEQAGQEINSALDLIEYAAHTFKLEFGKDYWYRLSLGERGDEKKYFKNDQAWDQAENILRNVLQKRGASFVEAPNEAAFYGPKVDIQMRNIMGKEDTAFTVQYDFVMPGRFNLSYIDKAGQTRQPIVVHRSSIGAIERVVAFLIEKYGGAFPLWLAPEQLWVLPISQKHLVYAQQVTNQLQAAGLRVKLRAQDETIGKRIAEGERYKVPYLLIMGDKEIQANTVSVRAHGQGDLGAQILAELIAKLRQQDKERG